MAEVSPERERALRRRHRHERQAVVFGGLVAGLAMAGLGATAVYTEVVSLPFLDREFTAQPEEEVPELPDAPCPPEGTMPVAYNAIQVTVLNGAGRTGLAGATAEALTARGFAVLGADDYPTQIPIRSQINFGEAGLAAAYTLAAHLEAPALVLDTRTDATVDLVLGEEFGQLIDPGAIILDPTLPLVGVPECVPLEQAVAAAVPGPAAPDDATPEEPQDGGEGFDTEGPADDAAVEGEDAAVEGADDAAEG